MEEISLVWISSIDRAMLWYRFDVWIMMFVLLRVLVLLLCYFILMWIRNAAYRDVFLKLYYREQRWAADGAIYGWSELHQSFALLFYLWLDYVLLDNVIWSIISKKFFTDPSIGEGYTKLGKSEPNKCYVLKYLTYYYYVIFYFYCIHFYFSLLEYFILTYH